MSSLSSFSNASPRHALPKPAVRSSGGGIQKPVLKRRSIQKSQGKFSVIPSQGKNDLTRKHQRPESVFSAQGDRVEAHYSPSPSGAATDFEVRRKQSQARIESFFNDNDIETPLTAGLPAINTNDLEYSDESFALWSARRDSALSSITDITFSQKDSDHVYSDDATDDDFDETLRRVRDDIERNSQCCYITDQIEDVVNQYYAGQRDLALLRTLTKATTSAQELGLKSTAATAQIWKAVICDAMNISDRVPLMLADVLNLADESLEEAEYYQLRKLFPTYGEAIWQHLAVQAYTSRRPEDMEGLDDYLYSEHGIQTCSAWIAKKCIQLEACYDTARWPHPDAERQLAIAHDTVNRVTMTQDKDLINLMDGAANLEQLMQQLSQLEKENESLRATNLRYRLEREIFDPQGNLDSAAIDHAANSDDAYGLQKQPIPEVQVPEQARKDTWKWDSPGLLREGTAERDQVLMPDGQWQSPGLFRNETRKEVVDIIDGSGFLARLRKGSIETWTKRQPERISGLVGSEREEWGTPRYSSGPQSSVPSRRRSSSRPPSRRALLRVVNDSNPLRRTSSADSLAGSRKLIKNTSRSAIAKYKSKAHPKRRGAPVRDSSGVSDSITTISHASPLSERVQSDRSGYADDELTEVNLPALSTSFVTQVDFQSERGSLATGQPIQVLSEQATSRRDSAEPLSPHSRPYPRSIAARDSNLYSKSRSSPLDSLVTLQPQDIPLTDTPSPDRLDEVAPNFCEMQERRRSSQEWQRVSISPTFTSYKEIRRQARADSLANNDVGIGKVLPQHDRNSTTHKMNAVAAEQNQIGASEPLSADLDKAGAANRTAGVHKDIEISNSGRRGSFLGNTRWSKIIDDKKSRKQRSGGNIAPLTPRSKSKPSFGISMFDHDAFDMDSSRDSLVNKAVGAYGPGPVNHRGMTPDHSVAVETTLPNSPRMDIADDSRSTSASAANDEGKHNLNSFSGTTKSSLESWERVLDERESIVLRDSMRLSNFLTKLETENKVQDSLTQERRKSKPTISSPLRTSFQIDEDGAETMSSTNTYDCPSEISTDGSLLAHSSYRAMKAKQEVQPLHVHPAKKPGYINDMVKYAAQAGLRTLPHDLPSSSSSRHPDYPQMTQQQGRLDSLRDAIAVLLPSPETPRTKAFRKLNGDEENSLGEGGRKTKEDRDPEAEDIYRQLLEHQADFQIPPWKDSAVVDNTASPGTDENSSQTSDSVSSRSRPNFVFDSGSFGSSNSSISASSPAMRNSRRLRSPNSSSNESDFEPAQALYAKAHVALNF